MGAPTRHRITDVDGAYLYCVDVTRKRAKNFWHGIKLLDPDRRRALCAVYAFSRVVDDIADSTLDAAVRTQALTALRRQLDHPDDDEVPELLALHHAARRYPVPLQAFHELLDGCEADLRGQTYATMDELVVYCRQVAGSIGRLTLGVFGTSDMTEASRHADALGVGLQLTNILRDVVEDRRSGRVYLPAAELERCSVTLDLGQDGELSDAPEDLELLVGSLACTALRWYRDGTRLLPLLDRRAAACCGALVGVYAALLHSIAADPLAVTRGRVSLPGWRKASVVVRSLLRPWP
ncbi:phytoene/squalene synthase family protein [Lentzea sp. E54]|uniref:phytoene/squalene synthase family protein n=1 Tax=Lentzea xerophila TaxID=3435883 RepID=UPI003DA24EB6